MEIGIYRNSLLKLTEVYEPIVFISTDGEELSICMRDTGFEVMYGGDLYEFKKGNSIIENLKKEILFLKSDLQSAEARSGSNRASMY